MLIEGFRETHGETQLADLLPLLSSSLVTTVCNINLANKIGSRNVLALCPWDLSSFELDGRIEFPLLGMVLAVSLEIGEPSEMPQR